jgi:hypothetical protein
MTEVTTNVTENEWRYFLDSCDSTKIYHTPEWRHFLESTFGYEPFYLFSKDGSGYIDGLLPLFYVKSKITGNRLCSVPFSHICGYIGSNDSKDKLINEGIRVYSRLNASYFEVRDLVSLNGFHSKNSFSTYILDLCPDIGEVWSKLEKKSSRWAIKKSEKIGVRIESTTSIEDLKEFYELNCITKRILVCHAIHGSFLEICLNT